jgi:hypothetical protein
MIDFTREHKLINRQTFCLLYPVPVVEDKKYLIEVQTLPLAELLIWAMKTRLLLSTGETFIQNRIHTDARTPVLALNWDKVRFQIFDQRTHSTFHIDQIESVMTRALINWAESSSLDKDVKLEKVQKLWKAQINCKTCKSLGILDSKFYSYPPQPLSNVPPDFG